MILAVPMLALVLAADPASSPFLNYGLAGLMLAVASTGFAKVYRDQLRENDRKQEALDRQNQQMMSDVVPALVRTTEGLNRATEAITQATAAIADVMASRLTAEEMFEIRRLLREQRRE